ncbi:hypothetical protein C0J52_25085 [Blattella germanica]|nr:hypothetical protein C0J52_25085 [Blattella germanica]
MDSWKIADDSGSQLRGTMLSNSALSSYQHRCLLTSNTPLHSIPCFVNFNAQYFVFCLQVSN